MADLSTSIAEMMRLGVRGTRGGIRSSDSVTAGALGGDHSVSFSESGRLVDSFSGTLNPEQSSSLESLHIVEVLVVVLQLAVAAPSEAARVQDSVSTSLNPLTTICLESCRLTDTVSTGSNLSANPSENVYLSDDEFEDETVRLSDAIITSLTPLRASPTGESLKLTDTVQMSGVLTASKTESVRCIDGPVSASLGGLALSVSLQETLRIRRGSVGGLHIGDTPPAGILSLFTSLSESVRLTDGPVTAKRGLTASLLEGLKVVDASPVGRLSPILGMAAEALTLADTVTIAIQLSSVPVESIRLSDTPVSTLDPLQVTEEENVSILEAFQIFMLEPGILSANPSEEVRIAAEATGTLDPLETVQSEALSAQDILTASRDIDAVLAEPVLLADLLTATMDLVGVVTEDVRLSESLDVSVDLEPEQFGEQVGIADALQAAVASVVTLFVDATESAVLTDVLSPELVITPPTPDVVIRVRADVTVIRVRAGD